MSARNCRRCRRNKNASLVVDSRVYPDYPDFTGRWPGMAYRRRECLNCGHRWTTLEVRAEEYTHPDDDVVTMLGAEYAALLTKLERLQALAQTMADALRKKGEG